MRYLPLLPVVAPGRCAAKVLDRVRPSFGFWAFCVAAWTLGVSVSAQVPQLINYQGRITVGTTNFDGAGKFKFALVDAAGTTTYWSNDGSSTAGAEPAVAVTLTVVKGLYSVLLGDATLTGMTVVPATVFTHPDVHLRVWFDDGSHGFQLLSPDKRIAAVGYAMIADSVPDGAVTTSKVADGAITSAKLAPGAVGSAQLASSSLTITPGAGLGGGGEVALGGTLSLNNTGVLSLAGGGGITVNAGTGAITLGSNATATNTAGAIVARDASSNFSAGTITASLNGNAASASSFTGPLTGDVTGTQGATAIASSVVTGKTLAGFASLTGTVTAADSVLAAIGKLDGNSALKAPLASPSFTGPVSLSAGTAASPPLVLKSGTSLTTPAFGAVEFDGSNLFVTTNSTAPVRKTLAFTDSPINAAQIADGAITSAKLAAGAAAANLNASGQSGVPSGGVVLSATENPALVSAGYVRLGTALVTNEWKPRTGGVPPSTRYAHTAVWTGSEMIVWGGQGGGDTGARYNPAGDTWSSVSTVNAPSYRFSHSAVWTGSEMIVWGGAFGSSPLADGGRYNPVTNTWSSMSTSGAPSARAEHQAVWTGTEMIIWGGKKGSFNETYNDGARYNPTTDTWTPVAIRSELGPRYWHTAVWTGTEMIVWGGTTIAGNLGEQGAIYNPATNAWRPVTTTGAPALRGGHTAVWTGSEMIIWGGGGGSVYSDGARYNPATDTWTALSTNNPPLGRFRHAAVWTGSEMVVWGGQNSSNAALGDGGRYLPATNQWIRSSSVDAPQARYFHSAVWTSAGMVIFGGYNGSAAFNDTSSFTPGQSYYIYQRP